MTFPVILPRRAPERSSRLLRTAGLEAEYTEAFAEWDASEDAAF
ncbi:hypothetical protein ACFYY1_01640 [Streptomyces sp. NPDC001890]